MWDSRRSIFEFELLPFWDGLEFMRHESCKANSRVVFNFFAPAYTFSEEILLAHILLLFNTLSCDWSARAVASTITSHVKQTEGWRQQFGPV